MKKLIIILMITSQSLSLLSCASLENNPKATKGSIIGGITGIITGLVTKQKTENTIAMGVAGVLAGGAVGLMMDKQEKKLREALENSEAASVEREGNLITVLLKGDFMFDTNSFTVKSGLYSEIDRIAKIIVEYPKTSIIVEGHTDSQGSESYNMSLSEKRAIAVQNIFIQKNVSHSRISITAFGESQPRATNSTPEGRQLNRRVEVKIAPNEDEV
ncbi:cell envelope biogenesis protein OmpA [Candidatus Magnetomorum sp. HK-1]|nr:cell envelope biogenesis protein OmpA [Candidatus Magnetomorum sp. HK-1]